MNDTTKSAPDETKSRFIQPIRGAQGSEELVARWLDRLGFEYTRVEDVPRDFSWMLRVTSPDSEVFLVGWQTEREALQVQVSLELDEPHQQAFLLMSGADKVVCLSGVSSTLSRWALEAAFVPKDVGEAEATPMNSPPQSITIVDDLLVDKALYCSEFTSRLLKVRGALRWTSHMFTKVALLRRWE